MKKKGFTLIELLVVVAIIALLISILLPSLSRARELTKRAVCSSNLRGIGSGCVIYSNENYEWFPQSLYIEPQDYVETSPERHSVTFTGAELEEGLIGSDYWLPTTTTGDQANWERTPISRSLFMLVIGGQCTSKLFICPSSGETEDVMRNWVTPDGSVGPAIAAQAGVTRFDFIGYNSLSYAYQMPFGMHAKPRNGMDPRAPLAADKGPYFQTYRQDVDYKFTPEELRGSEIRAPEWDGTEEELVQKRTDEWRAYNSKNHSGEGQNVLIADGHVEWFKTACVGLNNDNIYTRAFDWTFQGSFEGTKPANLEGPFMNTDTLLIP